MLNRPANRHFFPLLLALLPLLPAAPAPAQDPPGQPADQASDDQAVTIPWGPYLQNLTPTGVTVMWTASVPNQGVVEYGLSKDRLDHRQPAQPVLPDERHRQEAHLAGLQPDTTYYYRVVSTPVDGREPVACDIDCFRTPDPQATSCSFAVIADTHQSRDAPALAARLFDEQPQFILHAGDYNKTMNGLMVPYRAVLRRIPIYLAKGNHDHHHDQWASMPGPGQDRYYAFHWANSLFLCVDTNTRTRPGRQGDLTPGGQQYTWLENQLKNSTATWKFVFQHHPVYSAYRGGLDEQQDELRRLYEKYRVDLVFQGHMHHYDRSMPLRDGKAVTRADGGVIYITASGACGGYEKFPHPHRCWFIARQFRGASFVVLCNVNGRQAMVQSVTTDGRLFDMLELTAR